MTKRFRVVFAPEAEAQLVALYERIAVRASPATAERFTEAIVARCASLDHMPVAVVFEMTFVRDCES